MPRAWLTRPLSRPQFYPLVLGLFALCLKPIFAFALSARVRLSPQKTLLIRCFRRYFLCMQTVSQKPGREFDVDVAIIGGGLVGLATALALAHAGATVQIFDAQARETQLDNTYDGRASAISYANFRMLNVLGVRDRLTPYACPIKTIMVTDGRMGRGASGRSPGSPFLRFDADEIADTASEPLGWMVENQIMRRVLLDRIDASPDIRLAQGAQVTSVECGANGAEVSWGDKKQINARLVVGADGGRSRVRHAAGLRDYGWRYAQHGIVATVKLERSHQNVAHEFFLPSGPFAILPLTGNRANLVWTEKSKAARAAIALDDEAFLEQVQHRIGDFLGAVELAGPRWAYPLDVRMAEQFIADRAVLVGDAARKIHPIAGQGFNLGLKDAAVLAEVVHEARYAGLDIGAGDVLRRYQAWRRFDSMMLIAATDGFNRLFSNDFGPIRFARDVGMSAVNRMGPLRRAFARNAGAAAGEIPQLLRGEPLIS